MCDFFVCTCIYTRYIRQKEKERGREEASVHARCSSFTSGWYGEGEYIHLYIGDTVRPCNELCHRDSCANRDVHVCYTLGVYGYVRYAITATKARATKKKKNRDSLMCVPRMYVNTTTTGAHRSSLMNRIATIFSARVNTPTR